MYIYLRMCKNSIVSQHKKRPEGFDKTKILKNLFQSIALTEGSKTYVRILYDGPHQEADELVMPHIPNFDHIEVSVECRINGSETKSFLSMLDIIANINKHEDDDILYLLEDDYLHMYGLNTQLTNILNHPGVYYASLYDHPDKYTSLYPNLVSQIIIPESNGMPPTHWRTTPSTTNTFACKYKTLVEDLETHRKYSPVTQLASSDHEKFLDLWTQGRTLVTPMPSLSAHMEVGVIPRSILMWEGMFRSRHLA